MSSTTDRYQRGMQVLEKIQSDTTRETSAVLASVAPDMMRWIIESGLGDIYARPGLDLKQRELVTVTALIALGHEHELRVHLHAAMNVGWRREELVEVIMQMALYAGLPAAVTALRVANTVFDERNDDGAPPLNQR